MRLIIGFTLLLVLLVGPACQPAAEPPAEKKDTTAADIEALGQLREAYMKAENAGDAAAVGAFYTENAVMMPPGEPAVTGRAAIEAHMQQQYSMFTFDLTIVDRETKVAGDIAYTAGTHRIKLTPKAGGDPIETTGKQVVAFGRQGDGSWKLTNLCFNQDTPPPPMPAPPAKK